MKTQIDLFNAFFRIGIFGFGGGPTMIPLVHKEVVDNYQWMSDDEFANVLAIGNTLPGPIATKMAGYIGFKVAGVTGCINAVLATIVPIILIMIVGLELLNEYRDTPWVSGMAAGVVPIVAWMMTKLCYDFFVKGYKAVGIIATGLLSAGSLALILGLSVHPGLIVGAVLMGVLIKPEKDEQLQSTEQKG